MRTVPACILCLAIAANAENEKIYTLQICGHTVPLVENRFILYDKLPNYEVKLAVFKCVARDKRNTYDVNRALEQLHQFEYALSLDGNYEAEIWMEYPCTLCAGEKRMWFKGKSVTCRKCRGTGRSPAVGRDIIVITERAYKFLYTKP